MQVDVISIQLKPVDGLYLVTTKDGLGQLQQQRVDWFELRYWIEQLRLYGTGTGGFALTYNTTTKEILINKTGTPTFGISFGITLNGAPLTSVNDLQFISSTIQLAQDWWSTVFGSVTAIPIVLPDPFTVTSLRIPTRGGLTFAADYDTALLGGGTFDPVVTVDNVAGYWVIDINNITLTANSVLAFTNNV